MTLPEEVTRALAPAQRDEADRWWARLSEGEQGEFLALWDVRSEDTAYYAVENEGRTEWHELPIELRGYFVDPETHRENAMWKRHLREYVNSHEEIRFFLVERSFHICRAHARARRVLETGVIPAGFECPLDHADCPFARALALSPGTSILLGR